jgi:hypothetical protein
MATKIPASEGSEDTEEKSTYDVTAAAAYAGIEVEAESAEEAIEKAMDEVKDALRDGKFQLTEVEANEWHGDGWDIHEF